MARSQRQAIDAPILSYKEGVDLIQSVLSPSGAPVIGLYIYTASFLLLKSISRNKRYRRIKPHLIGPPAILSVRPGLSQTELAIYLGCERATAGLRVAQCMRLGLVKRVIAPDDRRKYSLHVTPIGRRMLAEAVDVIARHEREIGATLSRHERETLRVLLSRLMSGVQPVLSA
jgi:DNA-binding MarR family transcriptional regulator